MTNKVIISLLVLLLTASPLYAGNGDLIVNGNIGAGTTTPQTAVHSVGKSDSATWAGDTVNCYGGGTSFGIFGDTYGSGAAYTAGYQNSTQNTAGYAGGKSGGYFQGGDGGLYAGGGAGIIALGGAGSSIATSTQGGAGIYAQGGLNGDGATRGFAGYFKGNTVVTNGNLGVGTTSPAYPLQVVGTFAATTKNFDIVDPRYNDEEIRLVHSSLEGPEVGVYYRGVVQLINGTATVSLPAYFEALTRKENRTVLLTAKYQGNEALCLVAASDVADGAFSVKAYGSNDPTSCNHKVYWEVKAERSDVARQPDEQTRRKPKPTSNDFPPLPANAGK